MLYTFTVTNIVLFCMRNISLVKIVSLCSVCATKLVLLEIPSGWIARFCRLMISSN